MLSKAVLKLSELSFLLSLSELLIHYVIKEVCLLGAEGDIVVGNLAHRHLDKVCHIPALGC